MVYSCYSRSADQSIFPDFLDRVRLLQAACTNIVQDPTYLLNTPSNKDCLQLANAFLTETNRATRAFLEEISVQVWNILDTVDKISSNETVS